MRERWKKGVIFQAVECNSCTLAVSGLLRQSDRDRISI